MYETWSFQNVWRRDRDLNPGRHHCLTRFRIVRVQPLRHLCKGGGHTDAEAVRPEYIQTDASSILQEIGKKSNRFYALAGDFLLDEYNIGITYHILSKMWLSLIQFLLIG